MDTRFRFSSKFVSCMRDVMQELMGVACKTSNRQFSNKDTIC